MQAAMIIKMMTMIMIETPPKSGHAKLAQSKRIDQALLSGGVTVHENLCSISTLSTDYIVFGLL